MHPQDTAAPAAKHTRFVYVTRFETLTNPTGKRLKGEPSDVQEMITKHTASKTKGGAGFSLARFRGNKRSGANVIDVSGMVFDVDHGSMAQLQRSAELLKQAGARAAFSSTHSFTRKAPRVRVWVDTSRQVLPWEYEALWPIVNDMYEMHADPQAKDPGHFYYLPTCPIGATPFVWVNEGGPLDVDAMGLKPRERSAQGPVTGDEWLTLVNSLNVGNRDNGLSRIAGTLFRGLAPRLAEVVLHSINETHCKPPLSAEQVDKIAGSIARRELARKAGEQ